MRIKDTILTILILEIDLGGCRVEKLIKYLKKGL